MESKMLKKIFYLDLPINSSMLNDICGLLGAVVNCYFPGYLSDRSCTTPVTNVRRNQCGQIIYTSSIAQHLATKKIYLSDAPTQMISNEILKKNIFHPKLQGQICQLRSLRIW
jgi:hypothetical protein